MEALKLDKRKIPANVSIIEYLFVNNQKSAIIIDIIMLAAG